jgi:hypothetical protein
VTALINGQQARSYVCDADTSVCKAAAAVASPCDYTQMDTVSTRQQRYSCNNMWENSCSQEQYNRSMNVRWLRLQLVTWRTCLGSWCASLCAKARLTERMHGSWQHHGARCNASTAPQFRYDRESPFMLPRCSSCTTLQCTLLDTLMSLDHKQDHKRSCL